MRGVEAGFVKVNSYIFDPEAYSWSLPSGWTCPGAEKCLTRVDRRTGTMTPGPAATFRCYSAVTERFPSVRGRLWANLDAVRGKSAAEVADVLECMPKDAERVRIHSAGDFFSQAYFDGWLAFCARHPAVHFWAFTKSIPFWLARRQDVPPNLELQASYGGRHDHLIEPNGLKSAKIVYSPAEAARLGLAIDTDDRLAAFPGPSFALLENFGADPPMIRSAARRPQSSRFQERRRA